MLKSNYSAIHRFNKREEDFPSLREYNDYLEEVEDMSKLSVISPIIHQMQEGHSNK